MLNAPTMACDRVNLRRSVRVLKRQQIFETVPVIHRAPLSDEVAPSAEQVEPHYSTVPFRTYTRPKMSFAPPCCPRSISSPSSGTVARQADQSRVAYTPLRD